MSIQILNNISSIVAQNAVSNTQSKLQNTLQQLSTGLKINSGADDAAGLSIANGLGANIAALTQSTQNTTNGIGLLQTADGALSQVTTQLNRAVTLATEAANGGLTTSQSTALQTEFNSILNEINQIGSTTNFNGSSVFNGNSTNSVESTQGSVGAPLVVADTLTAGSVTTITDSKTGGTFVYTAGAGATIADLQTAIAGAAGTTLSAGTALSIVGGKVQISNAVAGDSLVVSTNDAALGSFGPSNPAGESAVVFNSDGTNSGSSSLNTTINTLSSSALGLNLDNLNSTTSAATALTDITNAINSVAAQRGSIGAGVNQLTADSNVQAAEIQNLTGAQNNVQNANIAATTSNLAQYNILEQTGFAALSQSNQAEQSVLKLLQ
jgi:flagellin